MGGFTEVRVKENGEQEIKGRKWRGTLQKNGRVYLSDTDERKVEQGKEERY